MTISIPDTIRPLILKLGLRSRIDKTAASNTGQQGEPAYTSDTKHLWIHDGTVFQPVQTLDMAMVDEDGNVVTDEEYSIVYEA
jgi:hypothetical protein